MLPKIPRLPACRTLAPPNVAAPRLREEKRLGGSTADQDQPSCLREVLQGTLGAPRISGLVQQAIMNAGVQDLNTQVPAIKTVWLIKH